MLLTALGGCDGSGPPHPHPPDPEPHTGETAESGVAPLFASGPIWRDNPDGARLMGFVSLSTTEPTTVTVEVDDGVSVRTFTDPDTATDHRVWVTGLRPDTTHRLHVTATGSVEATADLVVGTAPLPEGVMPAVAVVADRSRMEPGVTFLVMNDWMLMYDADGEVAWLMPAFSRDIHQVGVTARGTLLAQTDRTRIVELTLSGKVVRQFLAARNLTPPGDAIPVDVEALHHDVVDLPGENYLGLSIERRHIVDYPSSEIRRNAPPAPADVVGDVIVEFTREGEVVHEWSLLDRLDPHRIAYDSVFGDFWEGWLGDGVPKDWSHANALWYDEDRDEILVSLRHQDAVVALDRTSGEVQWIFAPDVNWPAPLSALVLQPSDPFARPAYHQHGVKLSSTGSLLMFDNANNRASAYEPIVRPEHNSSRGLEVVLDHDAHTWSVAWEWGPELAPPLYSSSLGDVDDLPLTGNRLTTFGNVWDETQPGVVVHETTGGPSPELVWSLSFPTRGETLRTYRAQRFTDVIPGR